MLDFSGQIAVVTGASRGIGYFIAKELAVIIEERRVSPRPDFISDLVNARDAGDKLNDRKLFDQIFGICGASLSATTRAAGGAFYLLYTHDDH